jgi:hypothetical protein
VTKISDEWKKYDDNGEKEQKAFKKSTKITINNKSDKMHSRNQHR